ncbi:MAG: ABC-type transport auxiliary lipoprotein family protein, partial [Proteobacteria bacterium]|nr:ABC-type transport auxiliary lipoprotein family protein [Pseudomonadota bacterium]
ATGGNVVKPARLHVWAEPINQGALTYLRKALSLSMSAKVAVFGTHADWDHVIEVFIETFHGHQDGRVELVAHVQIRHVTQNNNVTNLTVAETTRLQSDGYDALVETHKELLDRLASHIARALDQTR